MKTANHIKTKGFTLIELSIVLVIIGLLVGGVLVGRDLIKASEIRSQVSQMENFKTVVNTFKIKYNGIPGDLLSTDASAFGFFTMQSGPARPYGDGNGILESGNIGCSTPGGTNCFYAEFSIFFRHLSDARLINGNYSPDSLINSNGNIKAAATNTAMVNKHIPPAKIGNNASITVNSYNGKNYFTLAGFDSIGTNGYYTTAASSTDSAYDVLTPSEAFAIDSKIDDGKPNTGNVIAIQTNGNGYNISSNMQRWVVISNNNNCVTGWTVYKLSNTSTPSCSLSFKFQ